MVHEGLNNLRKGYTHEYTSNILAIIFFVEITLCFTTIDNTVVAADDTILLYY